MAAKKAQSHSKPVSRVAIVPAKPGRLSGKVAVITGASRGIGYAIARALAAENCNVVITGRTEESLTAAGMRLSLSTPENSALILSKVCDVRDPDAVEELFTTVEAMFGRLDILVNNAGIGQPPTPLEQTSLEVWRDLLDTNLTGMFLCTRAALPLMERGATIITNLSAAAKQTFPQFAAYTAAKSGGYGFTLSLRDELMPRGIRVTALMPGATATDMWQQIMPNADRERMIDVETVAQAVLYAVLLPPEANLSELLLLPTVGAV